MYGNSTHSRDTPVTFDPGNFHSLRDLVFSLAVLTGDGWTILGSPTSFMYIYVQNHVQQEFQLTNNSVVIGDGFEFCIDDTAGNHWMGWYRFREGVL